MRELDENGFLDAQIELVRDEIMRRHLEWEEAALFLNVCAMKLWTDWEPQEQVSDRIRYANGLMAKALSSYQGAIHLARLGMMAESMILSRTALECAAWLGYLFENSTDALRHFEGDEYFSLSGRMKSYAASAESVSDMWLRDAEALKRDAKVLGRLQPSEVLEKAKLGDHYIAFYKHFSGTAAHASVSSVARYLLDDEDGGSTLGPDIDDAEKAYFWAIQAMSAAVVTYSNISGTSVSEAQLQTFDQHWKKLIVKVRDERFTR